MRKYKLFYLIIIIFELVATSSHAQIPVTLQSLLTEMIDEESVARWPKIQYTAKQFSSYDRQSISPGQSGWFANDDRSHYIRTETVDGRKEQVMLDVDGPGSIVRFWLTTFKRNGIMRMYFDGNKNPEVVIPGYDLMLSGLNVGKGLLAPHSSYEIKEKGGSTLYLPLPFAKHCKVTWEDQDKDNQPRYYQINVRLYPAGTNVKTFTIKELKTSEKLVFFVNQKLLHPKDFKSGGSSKMEGFLQSGKELTLKLPSGPFAVRYLSVKIETEKPEQYEQALRSTILKISFDGQQTVWCPIGDFSGSGVGGKALQSWYRTVDTTGNISSRWIMPYSKSAQISLQNLTDGPVKVSVAAITGKWTWNDRSMYFHANWKNENHVLIKRTEEDQPTDWEFNKIQGRGVFLGDSFAVYNHMHKWYGEGDQKIWTDDAAFPTEFGTGAEDYYNTSWAPVVLYQTPFANAPRADHADSFGYNTFTRTRILDAVPFKKSFRYTLETLGWENGSADFAATTYWYGFKNTVSEVAAHQIMPDRLNPSMLAP